MNSSFENSPEKSYMQDHTNPFSSSRVSAIASDLIDLKNALHALKPSGQTGFEGLLAEVFEQLLDVPFRLAKSGSQFGLDGKASDPNVPICFEAKLYKDTVPSSEVLNKLLALAIREDSTELWVLGATSSISTQTESDLAASGRKLGISTVIFDWQGEAPMLATLLIVVHKLVGAFFEKNVPAEISQKAIVALERLASSKDWIAVSEKAMEQLCSASVAAPFALSANRNWLRKALTNRRSAKAAFGQALSPLEMTGLPVLSRQNLVQQLQEFFRSPPQDKLMAVLGDEGNGKSWLMMKCWAEMSEPPITLLLSAESFVGFEPSQGWPEFLVQKLQNQTGDSEPEHSKMRWLRRLERWKKSPPLPLPRLLVIVDGVNQRPSVDWGRLLDSLTPYIHELGGITVVTSRTQFFHTHIAPRLCTPVDQHAVPQWTDSERDEILNAKGLKTASLNPEVATSLRNPRLLGVALSLLTQDDLRSLEGLSPALLLFEYLRILVRDGGTALSFEQFCDRLQGHACTILDRVRANASDDLIVFKQMEPTAEGQFFRVLADDPSRYTLEKPGLALALGFAIIDELRIANRNSRDLHEKLKTVLEPVEALDQTAEAVLAALTIACLDDTVNETIGAAVLAGFTHMQNPDGSKLAAFIELGYRRPGVFCSGAETVFMAAHSAPNEDWLVEALKAMKSQPSSWPQLRAFIAQWLCYWWPDELVNHRMQFSENVTSDTRSKHEAERDQRVHDLRPIEKQYFDKLTPQISSPFRLMELSFQLLAGQPLSGLVFELTCAKFSMALSPAYGSPDREFTALIRFNRSDWQETREQLLTHARHFKNPDVSSVGLWTAVALWNATGDASDANEAHRLWLDLTKDRDHGLNWRLVESYCETDPCDPSSVQPENVAITIEKYRSLNVRHLAQHMGQSGEDSFWSDALPAMARFAPDVAVEKHREFLSSIPSRRGLPLRHAAWRAIEHSALLVDELPSQLLTLSNGLLFDPAEVDERSVAPVQQALLMSAFSHLTVSEQLAALLAVSDPGRIWLGVLDIAKPGDVHELSFAMRQLGPADPKVLVPLALAKVCNEPLPELAGIFPHFLTAPHAVTRFVAFQLAVITQDVAALSVIAKSDRTFVNVAEDSREYISGSIALINAAERGLIPGVQIIDRIAPKTYFFALARLDDEASHELAKRLDACVHQVLQLTIRHCPVVIKSQIDGGIEIPYVLHSLDDLPTPSGDFADEFEKFSLSEQSFHEAQQRRRQAYEEFRSSLTDQVAALVLEAFDFNDIQTLVGKKPELTDCWVDLLLKLSLKHQQTLRNFALVLARALTYHEDKLNVALDLYDRFVNQDSSVNIQYTAAELPLASVAIWSAADHPHVDQRRFSRLDCCQNDHQIATEVCAALYAGKSEILDAYIRSRLCSSLPVDVARAIVIVGFSDNEELASAVMRQYENCKGLLGDAVKACGFAMDRHRWAKHWLQKMQAAQCAEDFWLASVLFLKVVDGRFNALHQERPCGSTTFSQWWWSIDRQIKSRVKRWVNKREKKLFGSDVPSPIFLPS